MDTVIANKFIKTLAVAEEPPKGTDMQAQEHKKKSDIPTNNIFKTETELMYGGQGKVTNNISLTSVTATRTRAPIGQHMGDLTIHAWTILMKKSRERENKHSANRINNAESGSRRHNK